MKNLSDKIIFEALTFDDVLLVPGYSVVLPRDVDITTQLTRNIRLNAPIVSAAMDTVTEAPLAIAIAREGGIGVVHKNMSIDEQAKHVKTVKRAENGMIFDPITINPDATVGAALNLMKEYKIGGIPVVDGQHKLVGIVTNRDLRFEHEMGRLIMEVMTKENIITTSQETDLEMAADILQNYKIEKLPVVDDNNRLIGLITYKDITKAKDRPNACKDLMGRLRVAAAVGITKDTFERIEALVKSDVDAIVIDTAHGHSQNVIDTLKKAKKLYGNLEIIVGNIATAEAALDLLKAGADGVKVGIGPGSICTTRVIAGAIFNIAGALKGTGVPIIADGGVRYSGDMVKAIAAGASSIMAGSLFAGVEESPGETIIFNGRKYKSYRGMGSIEAMQQGSGDRYFQDSDDDISKLVPEGIVAQVPFKGSLTEVVYQMMGGLRAGMGYCGARNITELMNARFVRVTSSGITESHPHDVTITREAPNYSR
jgi:IMP dehydrogenase